MELERYTFVLLRRGPRADEYSDAELEEIQAGHLTFLDRMSREGHIYRTKLEETRRLTEDDPAIQSGRMSIEAMTWLTEKGALG